LSLCGISGECTQFNGGDMMNLEKNTFKKTKKVLQAKDTQSIRKCPEKKKDCEKCKRIICPEEET
jgi:hypothetical protein